MPLMLMVEGLGCRVPGLILNHLLPLGLFTVLHKDYAGFVLSTAVCTHSTLRMMLAATSLAS